MRILNWVQGRVTGKNEKNRMGASYKVTSQSGNHKEEFDDWPQSFLAIGTFGNAKAKKDPGSQYFIEEPQDLTNFTEHVNGFLKEINTSFSYKFNGEPYRSEWKSLLLDTSLNRISYLESEGTTFQRLAGQMEKGKEDELYPDIKIIKARTKHGQAENQHVFKRKSVSFLIKRLLAYRGGFAPAAGISDPISESRMEILKAMLQKKIRLHSSPTTSLRRYLQRKSANGEEFEKQLQEKADDGCVWNKTDSEYIVLEI